MPHVLALPLDVLRCVFAFLSWHGRLYAVSLVSKQWRAAALASIESISRPAEPVPAVALLSSLRHLRVRTITPPLLKALPPSLCSLELESDDDLEPSTPAITMLTSLSLSMASFSMLDILVAPSAQRLTSLRLELPNHERIIAFSRLNFPCLSSLEMRVLNNRYEIDIPERFVQFFARHAAHLSCLQLNGWRSADLLPALATLSFPQLGRFSVEFPPFESSGSLSTALCDLLTKCPASIRLSLPGLLTFPDATPVLTNTLAHCGIYSPPFTKVFWADFTRLSSLHIGRPSPLLLSEIVKSPHATSLTSLLCSLDAEVLPQIAPLSRLRTLTLNVHCSEPPPLPLGIQCPYITTLEITARLVGVQTDLSMVFDHMHVLRLLDCFPSLQKLILRLPAPISPSMLEKLKLSTVRLLTLEEVVIVGKPNPIQELTPSSPWCRFTCRS